jgi:hypothetical protein
MIPQPAAPVFVRTEHLPWRKLDHQTVIVNPRNREVHVLNGTGSVIWSLLGEGRSIASLVGALRRDFEGEETAVVHDVTRFLADLTHKGLVAIDGLSAER